METQLIRQLFLNPPNGKLVIIDDPQFVPYEGSCVKVNGVWFRVNEVQFEVIDSGKLGNYWNCCCFLKDYHHESTTQRNSNHLHRGSRPHGPRLLDRKTWSQRLRKAVRGRFRLRTGKH